jgi:hypothetical protein
MTTETQTLELAPVEPTAVAVQAAPVDNSPAGLMLSLMGRGASLDQIERLMDLQEKHERREAEKAFNAAFAAFKAEAVRVVKNRSVTDGPLKGKSYAELFSVVDAVTPALSRHGLSASWKLTKDDKDWIEVTCTIKHAAGHSDSVSMGGPPDAGGAKNAIQARASTISYLERYTLKAITGVAEGGEDDDGDGGTGVEQMVLDKLRDAAMEGTEALRATYSELRPSDKFWAKHSKALKAAAAEADKGVA